MKNEENYLKKEIYNLLKEDSKIFEFIQSGSLDGIWYWDLENLENEWMSPKFWEVFGFDPKEKKHLASEWQDLINPEDLKVALSNFEKHCEDSNHPYDQIVRYKHKNGSTVWIRCRGIAIRDENNKPIRLLGAHTDITQIKNLQHELEKQNQKLLEKQKEIENLNNKLIHLNDTLYTLIDVMPAGVIVTNTNGAVNLTNALADSILGVSINKIDDKFNSSKDSFFTLHRLDGSKIKLEELLYWITPKNDKTIKDKEILIRRKDGEEKIILGSMAPVHDNMGNIVKSVAAFKDITYLKHVEGVQKQLIKELSKEREKLNIKNKELRVANRSKNNFIANINHELKTPLNIVMAYLEYVLEDEEGTLSKEQREMLEVAYNNADRLQYLISDLLDISLIESHKIKLVFENLNLRTFFTKLMRERFLTIKDKNINIKLDIPEKNIFIVTDVIRLRQVIDNILDNAIKFNNEGDIEVLLKEKHSNIEIYIKDSGIGINPKKINEIFEPFYQIDESIKKEYTGVGLGLYIAKKTIRAIGGDISVKNNIDKGCCFKVTIPYDGSLVSCY